VILSDSTAVPAYQNFPVALHQHFAGNVVFGRKIGENGSIVAEGFIQRSRLLGSKVKNGEKECEGCE